MNRELKRRIAAGRLYETRQADALKSGYIVKPSPVVDTSGHTSTIGFGEGDAKTTLLVSWSSCDTELAKTFPFVSATAILDAKGIVTQPASR